MSPPCLVCWVCVNVWRVTTMEPIIARFPKGVTTHQLELVEDRPTLAQMRAVFGPSLHYLTVAAAGTLLRHASGDVYGIVGQDLQRGVTLASRKKLITRLKIEKVQGKNVYLRIKGKPAYDSLGVHPYEELVEGRSVLVLGGGADPIWVWMTTHGKPATRTPSRAPARTAPRSTSRAPARTAPRSTTKAPARTAPRSTSRAPARTAPRSTSRPPARKAPRSTSRPPAHPKTKTLTRPKPRPQTRTPTRPKPRPKTKTSTRSNPRSKPRTPVPRRVSRHTKPRSTPTPRRNTRRF